MNTEDWMGFLLLAASIVAGAKRNASVAVTPATRPIAAASAAVFSPPTQPRTYVAVRWYSAIAATTAQTGARWLPTPRSFANAAING